MTAARVVVIVMCCALGAVCSTVGPDDGAGGSGGGSPGFAGGGAGGLGGGIVVGRGGTGGVPSPGIDLPCLKKLFADCPTEPGTCQGVSATGGGAGTAVTHFCYASGTTAEAFLTQPNCQSTPTGQTRYYGEVYKPDGNLCYIFERTCGCSSGCNVSDVTFRSALGELIASGQTTGTLTCATGETCGNCFAYLPGFQCVEGTCP